MLCEYSQSLKVWLKFVLSWLKYSIFSRGLFFIGALCRYNMYYLDSEKQKAAVETAHKKEPSQTAVNIEIATDYETQQYCKKI